MILYGYTFYACGWAFFNLLIGYKFVQQAVTNYREGTENCRRWIRNRLGEKENRRWDREIELDEKEN